MDVNSLRIHKVFSGGGDVHYIMPYFQRAYAWEKTNWKTLLDDIFSVYEVYDSDNEPEHFMGALVVISAGTRSGTVPAFKLVDGQQRLTTISLLLCALGSIVQGSHSGLYRKIRKLLVNSDEQDELHYKLLPTEKYGDRAAYLNIVNGNKNPTDIQSSIPTALEYLHKQLGDKIRRDRLDPETLFLVIVNCLNVVFIDLDQRERPYEIFESLNTKGKPLEQPDLVRNYIAMKLPERNQENVFDLYWSDIENTLLETRTVSRIGELTSFLRHYLAYQFEALPNKGHVYARFRDRMEREFPTTEKFTAELHRLHQFASYYDRLLRPDNEKDHEIRKALHRLNILEVATAYPFLLGAYDAYEQQAVGKVTFLMGLKLLENYMVRRYLADEPTHYLNKMFPTLWKDVNRDMFVASLEKTLIRKNYPSDNRIKQSLLTNPIYEERKTQKLALILESINQHLSAGQGGHTVLNNTATIEHIMPQKPSAKWKSYLGNRWEYVHHEYLHTIGNLTLVTQEWNSSMSKSPYAAKRHKLSNHALLLNSSYFSEVDRWGEKEIRTRTENLTNLALKIWPSLGEVTATKDVRGQKPRSLIFLGESHDVKSWREVALTSVKIFSDYSDDFDSIAESLPSYFSRNERARAKLLSNGWWLYLHLSSQSAMKLCDSLMSALDISDEDWDIELTT